jgi:hypothetical protein
MLACWVGRAHHRQYPKGETARPQGARLIGNCITDDVSRVLLPQQAGCNAHRKLTKPFPKVTANLAATFVDPQETIANDHLRT